MVRFKNHITDSYVYLRKISGYKKTWQKVNYPNPDLAFCTMPALKLLPTACSGIQTHNDGIIIEIIFTCKEVSG